NENEWGDFGAHINPRKASSYIVSQGAKVETIPSYYGSLISSSEFDFYWLYFTKANIEDIFSIQIG
ncbi:MAG: hypothetical protein CMP10_03150, partial [Zetaproteobacteria bacterium]|nr:hypothetical protein [Pseudobdellovibrionaceae bacterium]